MGMETISTRHVKWEKAGRAGFPGDAEVAVLRDESGREERTLLIRIQAGGGITPHTHVGSVQHYVLDGEYQSGGESYGAGTYRLFPAHSDVSEIRTRSGATILMIYDPVG